MSNSDPFQILPLEVLARVAGGMRYGDGDRESTNVEDRRTPEGRAANEKWYQDNKSDYGGNSGLDTMPKMPEPSPSDLGGSTEM